MRAALRRSAILGAVGVSATFPLWAGTPYGLELGISVALFAVLSTGLNLVYGYTGLLSFAQVAYFGIAGYTSALLWTNFEFPMLAGALMGGLLAALLGLLIGYASLRLSRHAFAIVSLSLALLCQIVSRDWVSLTRGPMGIPGLSAPTVAFAGIGQVSFDRPTAFYYLMLSYAILVLALLYRLVHSRIGRAFLAMKLNQPLAESQGIDPLGYRLLAISISAAVTGIAGGLYVFHLTIVDPSIFDFYYTEAMLIMVIIGGPGSFWGVLVASLAFSMIPDLLRFSTDLRMIFYGIVLVTAMLVFPRGLGGILPARITVPWRCRAQA